MRMYFKFCVTFLAAASMCGEGAFAPNKKEEHALVRCLLTGQKPGCLPISTSRRLKRVKYCKNKVSGSASGDDLGLDAAKEYICALNDYQNTARAPRDVVNAILDGGSCGRVFPSVAGTWKKFLSKRGDIIRIHQPEFQYRNGSSTTVSFVAANLPNRAVVGNLKAADLIISRSDVADVEVYGKYALMAAIRKESGQKVIVHESLQATCPSEQKRFFVVGMNDGGTHAVLNWLTNQGNRIEFIVDLNQQTQILKGDVSASHNFIESFFDVGQQVSAIVLHFAGPSDGAIPLPAGMIYPNPGNLPRRRQSRDGRQKRSPQADTQLYCHRESYIVNYRNNDHVIRPVEFDLGECVGSCGVAPINSNHIRLNVTNHALTMLWAKFKKSIPTNPEPTVCCIPVSYNKFHYVTFDDNGILMSTYTDNMVTAYCGCR